MWVEMEWKREKRKKSVKIDGHIVGTPSTLSTVDWSSSAKSRRKGKEVYSTKRAIRSVLDCELGSKSIFNVFVRHSKRAGFITKSS